MFKSIPFRGIANLGLSEFVRNRKAEGYLINENHGTRTAITQCFSFIGQGCPRRRVGGFHQLLPGIPAMGLQDRGRHRGIASTR
jgi:hypothetical protein